MDSQPKPKQYFCAMCYDKPFFMEKYIANRYWFALSHSLAIYGLYLLLFGHVPRYVIIFLFFYSRFAATGALAGAHRLWSHRSFKAKLPLRILLAFMQTASMQHPIFRWVRDHRIHHKFSESNADPHDPRRGFWFSHIGWLMLPETKEVAEKEATLDYSDVDEDPVVRFQAQYFFPCATVAVLIVPMSIMHFFCPEIKVMQLIGLSFVSNVINLNITFALNSWAHLIGMRPYDKFSWARDSTILAFLSNGEGWHNYHHSFPNDYRTSEFGFYKLNWTTMFIDFFAWIGWAYDLKTVKQEVVWDRIVRSGDGTHPLHKNLENNNE